MFDTSLLFPHFLLYAFPNKTTKAVKISCFVPFLENPKRIKSEAKRILVLKSFL